MWENRPSLLSQSLSLQMFNKDAKQGEVLLSQQEHLLSKDESPVQWKDSLNDAWADLLELIDTRNQMLEASRELHKYFHDCKDVLSRYSFHSFRWIDWFRL